MRALLALAVLVLASGCGRDAAQQGVAARVNGKPIAVRSLQFAHSQRLSAPSLAPGEVLESLKAEYGAALAGLIVEELVAQELARLGMEVGEAQLRTAESALRQGYQGKAFEDTLHQEGVDLNLWRERLRGRLVLDMFASRVLRPRIKVGSEEVQTFYRENAQEFAQPAVVRFIRLESLNEAALRKALDAAGKASNPEDLLTVFTDVTMQVQAYPAQALPKAWAEAVKPLKPGQAGQPIKTGAAFTAFVLLERTEARTEGLVQVYPVIEKRLVEAKLAQEFSAWLGQALGSAVVEVNPGLVPGKP